MKRYSEQLDDRYYSILEDEFDLDFELNRLQSVDKIDLAANLEGLLLALTGMPPDWVRAETYAEEVCELGASDRHLEHLRNAVIRALSPLLDDLPTSESTVRIAKQWPNSKAANALAAARIIRIFGNEFDPH